MCGLTSLQIGITLHVGTTQHCYGTSNYCVCFVV